MTSKRCSIGCFPDLTAELKQRIDATLAKLAMLSDAPTQKLNLAVPTERPQARMEPGETFRDHDLTHRPHFESREPPGVQERRRTEPDPERDSLFDWFVYRIQRAISEREVDALILEAEIRHQNTVRQDELRPLGFAANPETTKTRDRRIARKYPGLSPEQVAQIETRRSGYCSEENIRRVRFQDGRDPETGHELPPEAFMKGPERKLRARELYQDGEGMPAREIARRFGVSHTTVLDWLGKRRRAA